MEQSLESLKRLLVLILGPNKTEIKPITTDILEQLSNFQPTISTLGGGVNTPPLMADWYTALGKTPPTWSYILQKLEPAYLEADPLKDKSIIEVDRHGPTINLKGITNQGSTLQLLGIATLNKTLLGLGLGLQTFGDIKDKWINTSGERQELSELNNLLKSGQLSPELIARKKELENKIAEADKANGGLIGNGLSAVNSIYQAKTGAVNTIGLAANVLAKNNPYILAGVLGAKALDNMWTSNNHTSRVRDDMQAGLGSDYGGTNKLWEQGKELSGKEHGFFDTLFGGKKKDNKVIDKGNALAIKALSIYQDATDRRDTLSTSQLAHLRYKQQMNGGMGNYTLAARDGAKLFRVRHILAKSSIQEFKQGGIIEDSWSPEIIEIHKEGGVISELEWEPEILEFKDGGTLNKQEESLTSQKNVIPEGALHKNKHNMENAEGLTKKGIPVIDNEGEQQAEIELNEIIFSLEVTKQLEHWYKQYEMDSLTLKEKDELAIKAGQLLVNEILFNTDDRTGLIDTLKLGGVINATIK